MSSLQLSPTTETFDAETFDPAARLPHDAWFEHPLVMALLLVGGAATFVALFAR